MTETPRKGSAIWAMLLLAGVACLACGVYRWRVPAVVESRAIVGVPTATDLGSLLQRPDVLQAAALDQAVEDPRLSGTVSAQKVSNGKRSVADKANDASVDTETWELTYQTQHSSLAVEELSALVAILKDQVTQSASKPHLDESTADSVSKVAELESELLQVEQALDALPETDPLDVAARTERIQTLDRDHSDALVKLAQFSEDWDQIEQEFQARGKLSAVAAQIRPGLVQEAILKLDRQQQLSAELTRLNESERRLDEIYGERHPRLIELRAKFDDLLTKLGGWDEIIDERHLTKRLQGLRESTLATQQELTADIALRLELETEALTEARDATEQRATLTADLEKLHKAVAVAQKAGEPVTDSMATLTVTQPPALVAVPWYSGTTMLFVLAAVCGAAVGRTLHRAWPVAEERSDSDHVAIPVPISMANPAPELDLAQRRALRQARLQQAYA